MLTIQSLNFSYGDKVIFHDLELDVRVGEHVVIVGDSGGGKSTLLNVIADEHSAVSMPEGATSTMVLQEGALLDHLNVLENLKLVARYAKGRNTTKRIEHSEIVALLEQLNIDKSLHQAQVSQLSGGQMRRVAIARALLASPQVVLFDEPDAGLDIANLANLAGTVSQLSIGIEQGRACITVSHNPFYIARVANKVFRLQGGKLKLVADWPNAPESDQDLQERQLSLQAELSSVIDKPVLGSASKPKTDWVVISWLKGLSKTAGSLLHWPTSLRDELAIAGYGVYLSFITGVLFFALVGLMLGSTTIAVVRMLADNALNGIIGMFVKPEMLLDMMGGQHVLYLAPAIGGMLFAARSGSIMSNWLGEMVRGRQVRALDLLGVSPNQYLRAPSAVALFLSMMAAITWFAVCVWVGGVFAAQELFNVSNATAVMRLTEYDLSRSLFWLKTSLYSALVALTVVALGLAPKTTAHQVNIHTTKTIIYATLSIALAELIIILS